MGLWSVCATVAELTGPPRLGCWALGGVRTFSPWHDVQWWPGLPSPPLHDMKSPHGVAPSS